MGAAHFAARESRTGMYNEEFPPTSGALNPVDQNSGEY